MPNPLENRGFLASQGWHRAAVGGRARRRRELRPGLAIRGDSSSSGYDVRHKLALNKSHVATIGPMVGSRNFAAVALAFEIIGPLVVWLSQNRFCGLPIADRVLGALTLGRFSFTQLQAART